MDEKALLLEQLEAEQRLLTKSAVDKLRLQYEKALLTGKPQDTQFEYAVALIRSPVGGERELGIGLLKHLLEQDDPGSFSRAEILYYLSKGYWWDGDYVNARIAIENYMVLQPQDRKGKVFRDLICDKVNENTYTGMAMVGASVAVVGGGCFWLDKSIK